MPSRPEQEDEPGTGNLPVGDVPPPRRPATGTALLGSPPPTDRLRGWLVTIVLGAIAMAVRFAGLGHPTDGGTPVFDEKHYVPQAWQMLRNGGVEDDPGFALVVHPPLAKQLIAVGEWLFDYNGFGWRASAAFAGVLTVVLLIRVTRRLTRSTLLGGIAGILLICDGLSHVQSRMGMLDAFLALTVTAAFTTLVRDRDDVRARLAVVMLEGRIADSPYGPRLGFRWWRLATGVLLGLGCGVKWSGLYWVAGFGVLVVLWDMAARRAAGVERPLRGTIVRDLGPALWALLLVPLLAYLSTWWAWFGSETAYDRHAVGERLTGTSIIPDALRGLWSYGGEVLAFHDGLTTQAAGVHPWESKPWAWPMGLRPMLYYYASGSQVTGCGGTECVSAVMLIGTPALWWPALAVLAFSLWRTFARFDWRYAGVLFGYGSGILPWFINIDRQMYFFYMAPVVPFLVIATVLVMGEVLGRAGASKERRQTGLLVVGLWIGVIVANFIWLWPILVGQPITPAMWEAQLWLPSWRQQS
ncbi:dolichyl-phosphate-mannose--protein mannosyltransferase [Pseudonocardia sp. GCM10023141]|uniref:dolichyl-phosphate-mannose--protein mannosyltransferase n=1 Tax=Pseudonocardia sp. GCM10023141 TaxID=3252653 RepID=UPI0036111CC2